MPVQYAWRHDGGHVLNLILHGLAVVGSCVAIMGSHMAIISSHEPAVMNLVCLLLSHWYPGPGVVLDYTPRKLCLWWVYCFHVVHVSVCP